MMHLMNLLYLAKCKDIVDKNYLVHSAKLFYHAYARELFPRLLPSKPQLNVFTAEKLPVKESHLETRLGSIRKMVHMSDMSQ